VSVRCVVFDLDDTLYLERDYVRSGFRAVEKWVEANLGVAGFHQLAWAAFEQGARGDVFDRVLASLGVDATEDVIARLVSVYRGHPPDITLAPDAEACLANLHRAVRLAVLTDGPLESQRSKVEALGLAEWCDPIVFTAELGDGFGKPDMRAFQLIEGAVGCSGEELAYVADNPEKDFTAPSALGWSTVRIIRPQSLRADLPSGPEIDAVTEDLIPLEAIVSGSAELLRNRRNAIGVGKGKETRQIKAGKRMTRYQRRETTAT
jgi:putative hydrolase of the HAD superfamily